MMQIALNVVEAVLMEFHDRRFTASAAARAAIRE
jgi:hypothetical protein